jgi:hypothetical protein
MNIFLSAPPVVVVQADSTPIWVALITSIIGGGLIGSIVSTYLSNGKDNRQARAKAREFLFSVEDARWEDTEYRVFRKAISEFESAALIARVSPELVRRYAYLATLGRREAIKAHEEFPEMVNRGLPVELSPLIEAQTLIIINSLWHPYRERFTRKRSAWVVDQAVERLKRDRPDFSWNVGWRPKPLAIEPGIRGWKNRRAAYIKKHLEHVKRGRGRTPGQRP